MDAEAVLRASAGEFAQKHHLAVDFAHAHIVVGDAAVLRLHVVELVVVGGEEGLGVQSAVLVDVLHDGPGDGDAVVGACASAQLVEEYERAFAHVVEDARGLVHLHHEGALAEGYVVAGSHAGEHLVDHAYAGGVGGHEAAALGHDDVEGCLAQERRLAAHVGAGYHHYLCAGVVELEAVGYIGLARRQLALDDGVARLGEAECQRVVHHGAAVAALGSGAGEAQQHVEACQHGGVELHGGNIGAHVGHKAGVKARLDALDAVLRGEYLLFVLLELGGDVSLGVDEGLLAYPVGRHLVAVGVRHLYVVAEHVVEGYLQRGDACGGAFALLHLEQVFLASARYFAQAVELGVDAGTDDVAATVEQRRGVLADFGAYTRGHGGAVVELAAYGHEGFEARCLAQRAYGHYGLQGGAQLQQLARSDALAGYLGAQALHVAHAGEKLAQAVAGGGVAEEVLYDVEAVVDGARVAQRKQQPPAQQAGAHWRGRAVDYAEQAAAVGAQRFYQLEVAHGEGVHAHEALLLDACYRADVGYACVLRDVEIVQDGACGHNGLGHVVDAETLERRGGELAAQALVGGVECEHPVVELERQVALCHLLFKAPLASAHHQHLLWCHARQQFVDVGRVALGGEELAGADVEEGHTRGAAAEVHGGQEVVLSALQHGVGGGHARRDKLGDASLHQFFGHLGVLELLADGHALAGADEFGQVGVDGVVGEARHLDVLANAVGALGECDAQYLRGYDGVLAVCLVEIAHAEKQHGIGMNLLHVEILLHQRRFHYFLGHVSAGATCCLR